MERAFKRWRGSTLFRMLYHGNVVDPMFKLGYVFFGALAGAYMSVGTPAGMHRIKRIMPASAPEVHERISFLATVFLGTCGGWVLYDGHDPIRAIVTGATAMAVLKQMARNA